MSHIKPFKAVYYNSRKVKDMGKVISPPYDVISVEEQDFLHNLSPYNFTHIDFGKDASNDDKINNAQLETLKKGETLIAPKTSMNGEKELHLFQLDQETNEIIKTRLNSISVPRYLMDIELTPQNRSDLLQGKTIKLEDKLGKTHEVAIDLIDPKGYSIKNQDQNQQLSVDHGTKDEPKIPIGRKL